MKINFRKERAKLVEWVRKQLIGPGPDSHNRQSDWQIRGLRPSEALQCGILFPVSKESEDPASFMDEVAAVPDIGELEDEPENEAEIGSTVRYVPPSSCGFSFYVEGRDIHMEIRCCAVRYELEKSGGRGADESLWRRSPYPHEYQNLSLPPDSEKSRSSENWPLFERRDKENHARLHMISRPHGEGWLVTLSMANDKRLPDFDAKNSRRWVEDREKRCLFEATLECRVTAGRVGEYPRPAMTLLSEEDQELAIQYRKKQVLAVGHGAGADWETDAQGVVTLRTAFMPSAEVPAVTVDTGNQDDPMLDLEVLARLEQDPQGVFEKLDGFIKGYEDWINRERQVIPELAADERPAANRLIERMERVQQRMRGGVCRLKRGEAGVQRAFAVANRAMALQMRQGRKLSGEPDKKPRWRPFQLGFLLMALDSTLDNDHNDRDIVDLIWFPTGGGKTEAYLALVALLVTWRRLNFPAAGGGTAVLMRYTLRLLTGQQFERANRLIFALEYLRRSEPELGLGDEPITIGLWVGNATTPNTFSDALEVLNQGRKQESLPRKLLLTTCPWCGHDFSPHTSFNAAHDRFDFLCQNRACAFHAGQSTISLPCNVVDEALYQSPPTLLIGTIDKFARLAWEPRTSAFLGGENRRPPELIIQDELHLIAGPLGSVAGIYEAAIDTVLTARGVHPKYIASTATIRNVQDQVRALYAREVAVFPPPGLDEADSWFARAIPVSDEHPGRLYVGYLAPGRPKAKSIAPLAAALLAAPDALFAQDVNRDALRDAWWTLVSYHSSLKGLGMAYGALDTDTPVYLSYLEQQRLHEDSTLPSLPARLESRERLQQLSSVVDAETNHRTFARLARRCDDAPADFLDVVVATNIIAVGVDVVRLAAMIVNGQPLTTAEYIQASSRVGRGDVPGLVFVNYFRDQVRSLSHYENFRAYHESFYRHVEPTSVIPFAYPCRKRALHAALVIVMRHGAGLLDERAVERFDPDDARQADIIVEFAERCVAADPAREPGIRSHLEVITRQWRDFVLDNQGYGLPVKFSAPDADGTGVARLLGDFDAKIQGLWPTLQSMRNVEHTALVWLWP